MSVSVLNLLDLLLIGEGATTILLRDAKVDASLSRFRILVDFLDTADNRKFLICIFLLVQLTLTWRIISDCYRVSK